MNGGSEKEYIRANPEQRKKEQGLWASVPLGRDSWCRGPVGGMRAARPEGQGGGLCSWVVMGDDRRKAF